MTGRETNAPPFQAQQQCVSCAATLPSLSQSCCRRCCCCCHVIHSSSGRATCFEITRTFFVVSRRRLHDCRRLSLQSARERRDESRRRIECRMHRRKAHLILLPLFSSLRLSLCFCLSAYRVESLWQTNVSPLTLDPLLLLSTRVPFLSSFLSMSLSLFARSIACTSCSVRPSDHDLGTKEQRVSEGERTGAKSG